MLKETQVVMLPTEKASSISQRADGKLQYNKEKIGYAVFWQPVELYFLSTEEIKEGDWKYNALNDKIEKCTKENFIYSTCGTWKKIIATTNNKLQKAKWKSGEYEPQTPFQEISKGLPTCSEGFIQKYIEKYNAGKPIEKVIVEYELFPSLGTLSAFDIEPSEKYLKDKSHYSLKLRDNEIIIHPVKDSWTREELLSLFEIYRTHLDDFSSVRTSKQYLNNFLEQYL